MAFFEFNILKEANDQKECSKPNCNEHNRNMLKATRKRANAAWATVGVTALLVFANILYIWLTNKSVNFQQVQTKMLQTQFFTANRPRFIARKPDGDIRKGFAGITNSGNLPAENIRVKITLRNLSNGLSKTFENNVCELAPDSSIYVPYSTDFNMNDESVVLAVSWRFKSPDRKEDISNDDVFLWVIVKDSSNGKAVLSDWRYFGPKDGEAAIIIDFIQKKQQEYLKRIQVGNC